MKIEPFVGEQIAAFIGSAIAARRLEGGFLRRFLYFAAGVGLANVLGESIAGVTGLGMRLAFCLVALFGLLIIESIFEMARHINFRRIGEELTAAVVRVIRRIRR